MDPQIKAQLKQVVGYATPGVTDAAGQVQVGSVATTWGRVEARIREVPMYGGVEERTQNLIIFAEDFALSERDCREAHFWLPGADVSAPTEARRAKIVHYCPDENGNLDHVEVYV